MSAGLLRVRNLRAWRGAATVLQGVDLDVAVSEAVAIVGPNGAGKSSLALAIAGHLRSAGEIVFDGASVQNLPAYRRARLGIGLCPEGRRMFPAMTVADSLLVGAPVADRTLLRTMLSLFPELERRLDAPAWQLSGGEQQMLALGRALMGRPRLLMLDEPFLGLSPAASQRLADALRGVARQGVSLLLADQDAQRAESLCCRSIFLDRGTIKA
ncbi:MAG: ABC transporter ATP-binding protein [Reyranellaceae bacterium]